MKRYIVSEQIIGILISKLFLDKKEEIFLDDLNYTIRSISYQVQRQCEAVVDFSGRDIYQFIYNNGRYFSLEKDKIVVSKYLKSEMKEDYEGIRDILNTKFAAGFPNDIEKIIDQNLVEI